MNRQGTVWVSPCSDPALGGRQPGQEGENWPSARAAGPACGPSIPAGAPQSACAPVAAAEGVVCSPPGNPGAAHQLLSPTCLTCARAGRDVQAQ